MKHLLSDERFGQMARGEVNPGRELLTGETYAGLAERASSTDDMHENLEVLCGMARGMRKDILEIGTNDGTSTIALLRGAADAETRVTSIDVADVPVAKALVRFWALNNHWEFIQGDSRVVLPALIAQGKEYGLILVDGDHSYEGCRDDVVYSERLLAPGGILLVHDSMMLTSDHDWTKPLGERGKRGCGLYVREMLISETWTGLMFPFGYNITAFQRRTDVLRKYNVAIEEDRAKGLLP